MAGTIARVQGGLLSRRAVAWFVAYAFLLQTLFAPLLAAPAKWRGADLDASVSELCIHDDQSAAPAGGSVPAGTHDDDRCQFCVSCVSAVLIAPQAAMVWVEQAHSVSVRWDVVESPVPDDAWLIGERARGPPLLT